MKIFYTLFFVLFISTFAAAQFSLVKTWDYRYGGNRADQLSCIQQTNDGGFILGGPSSSSGGGEKTWYCYGALDYWIVKVDSNGTKQWDKTFGGSRADILTCLQQTSDGGYLLGGYSNSPANGNKTAPYINQYPYGYDFWIVKTDASGNKLWDKAFGSTNDEWLFSVAEVTSGGYILGGNCINNGLMYVVRTDTSGSLLWSKYYGNAAEYLQSLQETADGGFIFAGQSFSGVGGDKSEPLVGGADYWIIKTDSLGTKQWDKTFGGYEIEFLGSILQTSDHGYIINGYSKSDVGGDKTDPLKGGLGDKDYWVVKTDSIGNKIWDKGYGGIESDYSISKIIQTPDGGYLIPGFSKSDAGADKTENNFISFSGQSWIIKTDPSGTIEWDKTLFTNAGFGGDRSALALPLAGGCYAFANYTAGGIAGYKTQPCWDVNNFYEDYWLTKFCPPAPLTAGFMADNFVCPGACVEFTNLSSGASAYQWIFAGANPGSSSDTDPSNICYSTPGSYDVILIASNSTSADTILLQNYITVNPYPSPQSILQHGDSLIANAGSAFYQWYLNGNPIPGATENIYVATMSGDYNLIATDANGCEVEAALFSVIANVSSPLTGQHITFFPNPVTDYLYLDISSFTRGKQYPDILTVKIISSLGKLIYEASYDVRDRSVIEIDCRDYAAGIYYLELNSEKITQRFKLIK